jgi:hypothetical protein
LDVGSLHTSEYPQVGLGLPNSTISAAEKVNMWDFSVPTFNLLDEDDGSTYVASHNEVSFLCNLSFFSPIAGLEIFF